MSMPLAVTRWALGEVVAPDLYSRAVGRLTKRSQRRKLYGKVKASVGFRPGWPYRRWLKANATRQLLRQCNQEAYDRLVGSLRVELDDRAGQAEVLVNATIAEFLATLEPSEAVAVADDRASQRFDSIHGQNREILDTVTLDTSFTSNLERLPPPVRRHLAAEPVSPAAKQLAAALAGDDPSSVLVTLAAEQQPQWLTEAPGTVHLAMATAVIIYGPHGAEGRAFKDAAERGAESAVSFARAAYSAHVAENHDLATELLDRARRVGDGPIVEALAAAVAGDSAGVLSSVSREQVLSDTRVTNLYANATYAVLGASDAAHFLTEAVERYPESPVLASACAARLWERSMSPACATRDLDRATARRLAVQARDVLRSWRANSREAAEMACTFALLTGDVAGAIRIGSAPPHGEALPIEAEFEPIRKMVADTTLTGGDVERAREIAAASDGFVRSFIDARLLVDGGGSPEQVRQAFEAAFSEAEEEEDRKAVWMAAADAGVDPLPDDAGLKDFPEFEVFVRGHQLVALGRSDEAIPLLRAHPDNEGARNLLATIYLDQGDVQGAVDELRAAADAFNESAFNLRAVSVLAVASRWDEAQQLADQVRADVVDGQSRDFLHDVGAVASANKRDWPDVERRVRTWIAECGWSDHRTWLLVRSLIEQVSLDAAWEAFCEAPDPTIRTDVDAQAWIILHARFQPGADTRRRILDLCDQFDDDPGVVVAATNASAIMGDDSASEEPTTDADGDRWRRLWELRGTFDGIDDSFEAIEIPDDADGIVEVFRSRMAQRAELLDQWTTEVRLRRWPYGMLSFAAGRPYTSVLSHRAVGCLPIAAPDPELMERELATAAAAIGETVIADVSALTTSYYIAERWPQLRGSFRRVEFTSGSLLDVNRAVADSAPMPGKAGTIVWDVETGLPIVADADPEADERIRRHVTWVRDAALTLTVRQIDSGDEEQPTPWQETIETARDAGLPLWADDLGLRLLAAEQGIPSFGTFALLHALEQAGAVSSVAVSMAVSSLRDEYCVDLPLDAEWLAGSARTSSWGPGPAMATFARPSTWDDRKAAYEIWRALAESAAHHDVTLVASWGYTAVRGLAARLDGAPAGHVTAVLAAVLAVCAELVSYEPSEFRPCAEALARAAQAEGREDPTEYALVMLLDAMTTVVGAEAAGVEMARLGSELVDGQREAYLRVILPTS